VLIVTLGDPHGVGIELVARLLVSGRSQFFDSGHRIVLIGNRWQWDFQLSALGASPIPLEPVSCFAEIPDADSCGSGKSVVYFLDASPTIAGQNANVMSLEQRGKVAVSALETLRDLHGSALQRILAPEEKLAVVTAPFDKHAASAVGWRWGGQTEFFEELWKHPAIMILAGDTLRVALATNHLALKDVAGAVSKESLHKKLSLLIRSLREQFGVPCPRIAVCGLNPHAGDGGLFGSEELDVIAPAISDFSRELKNASVVGPMPADTVFYQARNGHFDAVLAMYHDQGLGPLKTVHFDDAVNLSGGLPHLRISPDHGPARDLYLTKKASDLSMAAAFSHALRYLDAPR